MIESQPMDSVMVSIADNGESHTGGICVGDGIPAANSKRQRCAPSCVCVFCLRHGPRSAIRSCERFRLPGFVSIGCCSLLRA